MPCVTRSPKRRLQCTGPTVYISFCDFTFAKKKKKVFLYPPLAIAGASPNTFTTQKDED
jgi:hypothetical protein